RSDPTPAGHLPGRGVRITSPGPAGPLRRQWSFPPQGRDPPPLRRGPLATKMDPDLEGCAVKIADAVALAKGGRTVLVVPETQDAAAALFESIDPGTLTDVTHVRRTRGRELVKFTSGGEVRFTSAGSARLGAAR